MEFRDRIKNLFNKEKQTPTSPAEKNKINLQSIANLEQMVEFLRTASAEDFNKFISERLQYLDENDSGRIKDGPAYHSIEPLESNAVLTRFALTDDKTIITITNGLSGEAQEYVFDESKVISKMLADNIKELNVNDIEGLFAATTKVVFDYFGGRLPEGVSTDRYKIIEESQQNNPITLFNGYNIARFSAFKGTNKGWCHERSAIIHQLFKVLGIESQIVTTPVIISENDTEKIDYHSFNMIRMDGKTVLIDTSMMDFIGEKDAEGNFVNGNAEPYIEILPYESFDTLKGGSLQGRKVQKKNGSIVTIAVAPNTKSMYINSANKRSVKTYGDE